MSRPVRLRVAALAAVALGATILGACTPGGDSSEEAGPTTSVPAAPVTYGSPPVTLDMPFAGTLRITPDAPCPITVETSGSAQCLAFPEGTTLDLSDPTKPLLLMDNCVPFADGDGAEFGGIFLSWEAIEASDQERFRGLAELPRDGTASDGIGVVGFCEGSSRS